MTTLLLNPWSRILDIDHVRNFDSWSDSFWREHLWGHMSIYTLTACCNIIVSLCDFIRNGLWEAWLANAPKTCSILLALVLLILTFFHLLRLCYYLTGRINLHAVMGWGVTGVNFPPWNFSMSARKDRTKTGSPFSEELEAFLKTLRSGVHQSSSL